MKRLAIAILLVFVAACGVSLAQEHGATAPAEHAAEQGHAAEGGHGEEQGHGSILWKWANFAVLAAGLGYLIGKNAGPFFAARSGKIQKDMIEARALHQEAERRAAEVERRLANLGAEISAMREDSHREAEAEKQRIIAQSAAEFAKVQARAEQEIVAAGKSARMELRRYSAELAVQIAQRKIQARMTPQAQEILVDGFLNGLEKPAGHPPEHLT